MKKNKKLMKFAGSLKNISDGNIEMIKDNIKKLREKSTKGLLKKLSIPQCINWF